MLAHVFPQADVPVVQPSLNASKDDACHLDLTTRLAPLRARGILVLGADVLVDGYFGGSLSMTSYGIGTPCPPAATGAGAAGIPDPALVPPDQSNV